MKALKTITIVGRPNVGKSSLFNTLIRKREALTSPNPGLTRDRSYSYFSPQDALKYILIDTGGLMPVPDTPIDKEVNIQVEVAISEADLLIFVVDVNDGMTHLDETIADRLRKSGKPVIVAVNKSDTPEKDILSSDFYRLGFGDVLSISAIHKRNIVALIDRIISYLPLSLTHGDSSHTRTVPTLCIAGKPNVGKSTLLNKMIGEKRVIVDSKPGTTRNPAKCYLNIRGVLWQVVDLAGIWRKKRGKEVEEIISMLAARREINRADVVVLLLDLTLPLTFQDRHLAGWIVESGASVIIAGNKQDIVEEPKKIEELYRKSLLEEIPFIGFAPFIMISAETGAGIDRLYDDLKRVSESAAKKVSDKELEILLKKMISKRPPPEAANRRPIITGLIQESVRPPVFKLLIRHHRLDKIPQHWRRYIKNSITNYFDYYGVPVIVKYTKDEHIVGSREQVE